jgi:hypothetical protein
LKAVPWDSEARVQLARILTNGSTEREQLLTAAVTDDLAPYRVRAEAASLAAPHPLAAVSGTELALLCQNAIAPDAAEKDYQVEARIQAADQAVDPEVKLRLWRQALAIAPADRRVRLGALLAAIALRRDSLTLALDRRDAPDTAAVAESLAAAAERLDDLITAQSYLRNAIELRPRNPVDSGGDALQIHLNALIAEQDRRTKNSARQPVIKNSIEQDQLVRPRIKQGSAQ